MAELQEVKSRLKYMEVSAAFASHAFYNKDADFCARDLGFDKMTNPLKSNRPISDDVPPHWND